MSATNQSFSIQNLRTLIMGGTAGIGLGVARHFCQAGARVVITGRRAAGDALAKAMGADFVAIDVTQIEALKAGVSLAASKLGDGIDCLIVNAGVAPAPADACELPISEWRHTFEVNLFGAVASLQAGARFMHRGASVLFTSSPAGVMTLPGIAAYAASKAALNSMVRTAASELAPRGIRVNAVLPGVVRTEMVFDKANPEKEFDMLATLTQTGAVREIDAFGPIFQFLASAAATPCTGALLACDDGLSLGPSSALLQRAFDRPPTLGHT